MKQLTPLQCGILRNALYHGWKDAYDENPRSLLTREAEALLSLLYENPTYPEGIYIKELNDEDSDPVE